MPRHLLCFLPTEKDILELQDSIQQKLGSEYIVLPLYGRLGPKEQKRIFQKIDLVWLMLNLAGQGKVQDDGS